MPTRDVDGETGKASHLKDILSTFGVAVETRESMKLVGYLLNTERGPAGEPGPFYNYVLAGNGVFVKAASPLLSATVLVAPTLIRGLMPLEERVELAQGKIPERLYKLAISVFCADCDNERYLAIVWDGEYHLRQPPQEGGSGGVRYETRPNTILDIHSHGTMSAFFSYVDDRDEQGLKLYMVVGRLDTLIPEVEVRVGVYGYFAPIKAEEIFA